MSNLNLFKRTVDWFEFAAIEVEGDSVSMLSDELADEVGDFIHGIDWNNEEVTSNVQGDNLIPIIEDGSVFAYYDKTDEVVVFADNSCSEFSANLSIAISSSNAAFYDDPTGETVRILEQIIEKVKRQGYDSGKLLDISGAKAGDYHFDLRKFGD